jgi:type I protein arginine methyltransferase
MFDIAEYGRMMGFRERVAAYASALCKKVEPGTVVLDIGTGSGILSFLACRAGAAKVYAIEPGNVIQLARDAARKNGLADRIEFIQGLSTEIELPEKVGGIVSDIRGVLPFYSSSLASIIDACDRFLKPDGWIIPGLESVWAALASCPEHYSRLTEVWSTEPRFDFEEARAYAVNSMRAARLPSQTILVEPKRWAVLDYRRLRELQIDTKMCWQIERDGLTHGICVWYDCETSRGFGFSNSPASSSPFAYNHAFFPFVEAMELSKGDLVEVVLRADFVGSDYVFSWDTIVKAASGATRKSFRQSTFLGTPISEQRRRKRSAHFIPDPNLDCAIDSRIMDLMRRREFLSEIARVLMADFPEKFKDWNAALARVADLSEKYSK